MRRTFQDTDLQILVKDYEVCTKIHYKNRKAAFVEIRRLLCKESEPMSRLRKLRVYYCHSCLALHIGHYE